MLFVDNDSVVFMFTATVIQLQVRVWLSIYGHHSPADRLPGLADSLTDRVAVAMLY